MTRPGIPTLDRAPGSRHGNWNVKLKLGGIQRRGTKIIKRERDYSYEEKLEKFALCGFYVLINHLLEIDN